MPTVNITAATYLCHQVSWWLLQKQITPLTPPASACNGGQGQGCSDQHCIHGKFLSRTLPGRVHRHQALHALLHRGQLSSSATYFLFMLDILQSLALEMEGTGVLIQEIDPGVVNTEMTKVAI